MRMTYPDYLIVPRGDGTYIAKPMTKAPAEQFKKATDRDVTPIPTRAKVSYKREEKPVSTVVKPTWEMLKARAKEMAEMAETEDDSDDLKF
jgi:hypothetical protein